MFKMTIATIDNAKVGTIEVNQPFMVKDETGAKTFNFFFLKHQLSRLIDKYTVKSVDIRKTIDELTAELKKKPESEKEELESKINSKEEEEEKIAIILRDLKSAYDKVPVPTLSNELTKYYDDMASMYCTLWIAEESNKDNTKLIPIRFKGIGVLHDMAKNYVNKYNGAVDWTEERTADFTAFKKALIEFASRLNNDGTVDGMKKFDFNPSSKAVTELLNTVSPEDKLNKKKGTIKATQKKVDAFQYQALCKIFRTDKTNSHSNVIEK